MNGNICRCGTYGKIKLAIKAGAQAINSATVQTFDPRAVETQS